MGSRMMKNIKIKTSEKGNDVISFSHSGSRSTCTHSSATTELIRYCNKSVYFHSSSSQASRSAFIYSATEDDFEILKRFLSNSNKFVTCGRKHIFSLDKVQSYVDNGDVLSVDCVNKSYNIRVKDVSEIDDFINAMRDRLNNDDEDVVAND